MNEFLNNVINYNELSEDKSSKFLHEDDNEILLVLFTSNTILFNTQNFLIHVVISLGYYNTEIYVLCHP